MSRSNQLSLKTIQLVRRKMTEQGLNSSLLAGKMGITPSGVLKIVTEGRAVTLDRLLSLSVALQYNFFEEIGQTQELQSLAGPPVGPRERALQQQVADLEGEVAALNQRIHDLEVEKRTLWAVMQQANK